MARLDVGLMKPAPMETADIAQTFRQQLILAQVRIMELEDARDELASRLAQVDQTLTEMQSMIQTRISERDRLTAQNSELEAQLSSARLQLAELDHSLQRSQARESELRKTLAQNEATSAERQACINKQEVQLHALRISRSWRWTAPLRSLERLFRRTPRE